MQDKEFTEIINTFKELGFTEYESKVYLALLQEHPASAYTISQKSDVPHSRVYDVARRLIKKGVLVSAGNNPETYSPLSPDEVIAKLKVENENLLIDLQQRLADIPFYSDFDPVWNLRSRSEAFEKARELIDAAREKVFLGFWEEDFPLLEENLRAAAARGAAVFLLVYGNLDVDFCEIYSHSREHMGEFLELGLTLDLAVDSSVCLTGILGNEKGCQVVWTMNRGLVQTVESYITHDFYLAEIAREFGQEMADRFGKNLFRLRRKFS